MSYFPSIESVWVRDPILNKFRPDAELRNPLHGLINTWILTEKIDGQNISVEIRGGIITVRGRREDAQLKLEVYQTVGRIFAQNENWEELHKEFGDSTIIFYGEFYKTQEGPNIKVFDIQINDIWLSTESVIDICGRYNIPRVHILSVLLIPTRKSSGIIERIPRFQEELLFHTHLKIEGVVARPPMTMFDNRGNRVMWKLCFRDLFTEEEWEELQRG